MAQRGERTDERTYGRKISPFYRTLSPIGAAALPPPMKTKEKVEQGKGTADHLMPLGYLFYCFFMEIYSPTLFTVRRQLLFFLFFFFFFPFFSFSFLGSGPDRGQSPVEWGDFPFVRSSVHPFVRSSVRPSPPRGPKSQPVRP